MTSYYIKTFGCQMNHSDSERIAAFLESQGMRKATEITQAGIVIYTTCGVRQMAENRVYGQIHNLQKKKPHTFIILTGCLAKRPDVQRRLQGKVDLFCEIKNFPKEIEERIIKQEDSKTTPPLYTCFSLLTSTDKNHNYLSITPKYTKKYAAHVPIMTGCNNFCAYCVVPYARGPEVSRPAEEILKEVHELINQGFKEIVLLGQNVNSYQHASVGFSELLSEINAIPGHFWINFISSHPKDYSSKLIETITLCEKVCETVHLPLQAGDDVILAKMNRKYTSADYLGLIQEIKKSFTKNKSELLYAITSDIIVGFPGETRKQFLQSAEIMQKVGYDMVYFGQFSPRPGTAAWKMKDNVTQPEKAYREKYLNQILADTTFSNNKKYMGKVVEVLIESQKEGFYYGRTRTSKNIKIRATRSDLIGQFATVEITRANIWNLEGKIK